MNKHEIETVAYPQDTVAYVIDDEAAKTKLLRAAEALGSLDNIPPVQRIELSKMLWHMANNIVELTQLDVDMLRNSF